MKITNRESLGESTECSELAAGLDRSGARAGINEWERGNEHIIQH